MEPLILLVIIIICGIIIERATNHINRENRNNYDYDEEEDDNGNLKQ